MLEWAKAVGDAIEADETIVEISTDKVDAEVPAPACGTRDRDPRRGRRDRHGRPGDRPDRRRRRRSEVRPRRPRAGAASAPRPAGDVDVEVPDGSQGHAGRQARRRRPRRRPRRRAGQRPRRPHRQGRRARRRQRRRRHGATPRREAGRRDADQGRLGDARPLHGRVALGPDRDLVPHDHRHDARRAPQAAQGGRPPGLLHAPDRVRDRARGDRADAGDGAPLRGDRRQAARDRRRRRATSASPSTSSARTAGAR